MGALAKEVDPHRLFSSGTIAPYATGGDSNFRIVQESPAVDISSMHEYDYNEAESHLGPAPEPHLQANQSLWESSV